MENNWIDFKLVKQIVSVENVLKQYNVSLRRVKDGGLRGACPLPTHTSKNDRSTFVVDTGKNVWVCQSASCTAARGGRKGGNVLDFVSVMEQCNIREAAIKLHSWFISAPQPHPSESQKATTADGKDIHAPEGESGDPQKPNQPLTFSLKDVTAAHPYLVSRNISEETLREFGVGFFPGRGSMAGRVVIPIHSREGSLIAYAGRSIDLTEPRYKLPAGFKKSLELYSLHRVLKLDEEHRRQVIVVEGFFDCMKVYDAGFQNVIALMGCTVSEIQETILTELFRRVVLLLDGDEAGREGAGGIAARLIRHQFVRVVDLPDGRQPDGLTAQEIQVLLGTI